MLHTSGFSTHKPQMWAIISTCRTYLDVSAGCLIFRFSLWCVVMNWTQGQSLNSFFCLFFFFFAVFVTRLLIAKMYLSLSTWFHHQFTTRLVQCVIWVARTHTHTQILVPSHGKGCKHAHLNYPAHTHPAVIRVESVSFRLVIYT